MKKALESLMFIACLCFHASAQTSPKDIPTITKEAIKAVVLVVTSDSTGKEVGQGSGFLVSRDGKIITNYHVIENAESGIVKFSNGAFYVIQGVLAIDKKHDLAVLKADGKDFSTLSLGNSDEVQVGEEVVAIGSPQSLESTVTNGIVSAVRELKTGAGSVIQTTAPISPGSSGGALFNMQGYVIGVTAFQLVRGQNLNFAIPVNYAKPLLAYGGPAVSQASSTFKANEVTGTYSGTVTNLTFPSSARIEIKAREDEGGTSGCMTVHPPLGGSGRLEGVIDGDSVQFSVISPMFEIVFQGLKRAEDIEGKYVVTVASAGKQNGTFELHRLNLEGPPLDFDTSTCPTD